jgi:hypothetical protein
MKSILRLSFLFAFFHAGAQTWNLPPRDVASMNGTQFVAYITNMSFSAREAAIEQEILNGNVPSFYRTLQPVTSTATISGNPQSVTYYVTPDYLAVGTDTNYFLCPMSPIVATHIGDATGCTLPTRKMVNDIYAAASVKLTPQPIPASGQMTMVPVFDDHNDSVLIQRNNTTWGSHPLGELTGGDKKDVVISNQIYTTANRVVIYGWHTSVGNPIQPLSNVHADTYMDYSHGIRMIQNAVTYNGNPTTVQAILQSSTLYPLLSDEGVISNPQYPYSTAVTSLATPVSFGIKNNGNNTVDILVSNDNNATHYKVYTSIDGINFAAPQTLVKTNLTLSSLTPGQISYIKIAAYNQTYTVSSSVSEVLAVVPSASMDTVLIVNGFDRASAGNTYNFVIQHGTSILNKGYSFSSCTNEAIQNNLFTLNSYPIADWILGEESSVNETFSTSEQNKVMTYLQQGGYLFVSGSEIGWDLIHLGNPLDTSFYHNYLKANYVNDAPNGQAAAWYAATENSNSIFHLNDTVWFDNGSHGTYNVDYPDVIAPMFGSTPALFYTNNGTDAAAVSFKGIFNGGSDTGKVVYMAFPFETIYPGSIRDSVMSQVIDFFLPPLPQAVGIKTAFSKTDLVLYPNPARDQLYISHKDASVLDEVSILSPDGTGILKLEAHTASLPVNTSGLPAGLYLVRVKVKEQVLYTKFVKQ